MTRQNIFSRSEEHVRLQERKSKSQQDWREKPQKKIILTISQIMLEYVAAVERGVNTYKLTTIQC